MIQDKLYKVSEVADILRVDKSVVYKMITSGEIEYLAFRTAFRIKKSEVERLLNDTKRGR